jgi:hypothetical protein
MKKRTLSLLVVIGMLISLAGCVGFVEPPSAQSAEQFSFQKYNHIGRDRVGNRVDLMNAIAHQPTDIFKLFKTQTNPKALYAYLNNCISETYVVLQSILTREYIVQTDLANLDKILINLDLDEIRKSGGEIDPSKLNYTDHDCAPAILGYRAMGIVTAIDIWIGTNNISTETIDPILEYRALLVKYISTQKLVDLNKARSYQIPDNILQKGQ